MNFRSDTTASVHPAILDAIARANAGRVNSYGDDALTHALTARLCACFDADVEVLLTTSGTATNAIALAGMVDPWGAVLCHREAHIETDECGAPGFFAAGAKLVLIDGDAAKITVAGLHEALSRNQRGVHSVLPQALSISQCTERGAVYAPEEVQALTDAAHAAGLKVHMDGARFANAVAHLGCAPRAAAAGVDVLSFGATKNGAMAAEAIIVFDRTAVRGLDRLRKRSGHLVAKHRFLAAQMLAYLEDDLWLALARRANALALQIAAAAGDWVSAPVQSNHVFIRPGARLLAALRAGGADFYDWGPHGDEARLVVSWDHGADEVEALCALLRSLKTG
ncbi:MAG: beta-eliminating lyase-related protein [Hyphomonadaceae bacterium]|nr:beta-eliminating lyase-related protein [Hyphomonadaceae bacterium]